MTSPPTRIDLATINAGSKNENSRVYATNDPFGAPASKANDYQDLYGSKGFRPRTNMTHNNSFSAHKRTATLNPYNADGQMSAYKQKLNDTGSTFFSQKTGDDFNKTFSKMRHPFDVAPPERRSPTHVTPTAR